MTETRLQDVIVPEHFNAYSLQMTTELSRFRRSGIVVDFTAELGAHMGGTTVHMPYFNDLEGDDEVVDDTEDLTVAGITTSQDIAAKLYRAKPFGASDLSGDLAGSDPVKAIATRFAEYWVRREQEILIAACSGALSAASMASNVLDISGLSGSAANFDPASFIDAQAMLGDHQDMLSGVAVHSRTYTAMKKADLIEEIRPSDGGDPIPVYQGKVLIVDDKMPYNPSTGIFTTYIFGQGAIGYVQSNPKVPVEVVREALKGGGQDIIVQRRMLVMHPRGVKWIGTPVKQTPSNAELAVGSNWTRCFDAKNVRIVKFVHKVG
ncbi:MAG: major capsid protein [Bacteroidota bacterium]